ncbi:MAG: hypothetical protein HY644_02610 [Acidobacteria bacterium]|nr:hypothetical protein [Acidobacteriota bacterium]
MPAGLLYFIPIRLEGFGILVAGFTISVIYFTLVVFCAVFIPLYRSTSGRIPKVLISIMILASILSFAGMVGLLYSSYQP